MQEKSFGQGIVDSFKSEPKRDVDKASFGPQRRQMADTLKGYEDQAESTIKSYRDRAVNAYKNYRKKPSGKR